MRHHLQPATTVCLSMVLVASTVWPRSLLQPCNNTNPCPIDCIENWVVLNSSLCIGEGVADAVQQPLQCLSAQSSSHTNRQLCAQLSAQLSAVIQAGHSRSFRPVVCAGHCSGGEGFVPETYLVQQADMFGGVTCPHNNNSVRCVREFSCASCPVHAHSKAL